MNRLFQFFLLASAVLLALPAVANNTPPDDITLDFTGTIYGSNVSALNGQTIIGTFTYAISEATPNIYTDGSTFIGSSTFGDGTIPFVFGTYSIGLSNFSTLIGIGGSGVNSGMSIFRNASGNFNEVFLNTSAEGYWGGTVGLALVTSDYLGPSSGIFADSNGGLSFTQPINWQSLGATTTTYGSFENSVDIFDPSHPSLPSRTEGYFTLNAVSVSPIPEPKIYALMLVGLGLVICRKKFLA